MGSPKTLLLSGNHCSNFFEGSNVDQSLVKFRLITSSKDSVLGMAQSNKYLARPS